MESQLLPECCSGNVLCLASASVKIGDICILKILNLSRVASGLRFLFLFPFSHVKGILGENKENEMG